MGELTGSPLVDLGITAVQEAAPNLSPADVTFLRDMFDGLVQGTISHPEVVALLQPFPGATEAIDRVERILRIPPPPFASGSVGKEHETRWEVRAKCRPWSAYEDERLLAAIHRLGTADWSSISNFVGNNRSKGQCYQRWMRCLDPTINKSKWTKEEDFRLLMFVALYGAKAWSQVCIELGDRCDVQCRYRYTQLSKNILFPMMQQEARIAAAEFEQMNGARVKRRITRTTVEPAHPVPMFPMYYVPPLPAMVFTPYNPPILPMPQIAPAGANGFMFVPRQA